MDVGTRTVEVQVQAAHRGVPGEGGWRERARAALNRTRQLDDLVELRGGARGG